MLNFKDEHRFSFKMHEGLVQVTEESLDPINVDEEEVKKTPGFLKLEVINEGKIIYYFKPDKKN